MGQPVLRDGLLYLVVFGPGTGESVVLRIPGDPEDVWCVIDSCAIGHANPAKRLLAQCGACLSLLAISHPHDDHAARFAELMPFLAGNARLGVAWPRLPDENWDQSLDARRHHLKGSAEGALAAILRAWQDTPARKWEMSRGQDVPIGACSIEVLNPDLPSHAAKFPQKVNRLSTALLVTWQGCRLLLGGDVEKDDWREIQKGGHSLVHHGCKVPHHGSANAWHASWMTGPANRAWCITPWHGKSLPWSTTGGVQGLLDANRPLHVTSDKGMTNLPSTCQAQRHPPHAAPAPQRLPGGMGLTPVSVPQDAWSNYVALGFDAQGTLADQQSGDGSVSIG